jgi:hypothetical protein
MTTPRLGAPELVTSQANKEETVNQAVRHIEAGAGHFIFIDRNLNTPPGAPSDGDCYLVGGSPTGAWALNANDIAVRVNTTWAFINVVEGFTAWVNDENVFIGYDGSAWNTLATPSGLYLPLTGGTLSGDLIVPEEAYDATAWNGSLEVPTKNAVRDKIEAVIAGAGVAELDDVGDVNAPSPSNGDVLTWDSTPGEWVAAAPTGGSNALDDLTDVNTTGVSDGDVLTYDNASGDWIAAAPTGGGGGTAVPTIASTGLNLTQGAGATVTDTGAGIHIVGSGTTEAAAKKAAPATPYTITAKLVAMGNQGVSLGFTNGTAYHSVYVDQGNGDLNAQWGANFSAYAGGTVVAKNWQYFETWLRIRDDGTNVVFSVSLDGYNFEQVQSIAKASGYLGATGYTHVWAGGNGGATNRHTILEWRETA